MTENEDTVVCGYLADVSYCLGYRTQSPYFERRYSKEMQVFGSSNLRL